MITTIYLDMDGVIVDFRKQCENYKCIEGTKVNWHIIHEAGPEFWEECPWTESGESFYKWLDRFCKEEDIELYILSAVAYEDGKIGKINWLKKHTNIDLHHTIIVPFGVTNSRGTGKEIYANKDSILIDDFGKNGAAWEKKKGIFVHYKSPEDAKMKILEIVQKSR